MTKTIKFVAAVLFGMLAFPALASAQLVVTTCGTLPHAFTPGPSGQLVVDVNGQLCTAGGGGGSGGTSSNFGSTFPTAGTAAGFSNGTNMIGARATAAALADGFTPPTSGLLQGQFFPFLFNGSTFDRAPGDATSGAYVNVRASVLPTGAATSALQTTGNASLASILSAIGTPMQQTGGSVSLSAAVPTGTNVIGRVGIDQTTPGTTNLVAAGQNGIWTVQPGNTANTTPWLFQIRDAAGNARGANVNASNQLSVTVDNTPAVTVSGVATAANQGLITSWGGVALGAPSNYGTSPGAVVVPGVNAYVTNIPTVNQGTSPWIVAGPSADAAAIAGNPVTVGGWDGTNGYRFRTSNTAITNNYTPPTAGLQQVQSFIMTANGDGTYSPPTAISTSTNIAAPATEYVSVLNESKPYASTMTPVTSSATGTTAAVVATLAGTSGKTTYICGLSITSDAVAGLSGTATVTGPVGGTMSYIQGVGVAPAVSTLNQNFNPCIAASAQNTSIVVTSAAAGTGGTTAVNAWGMQQ